MDWDQLRADTRKVVHGVFGISATYAPPSGPALTIRVRLHTRKGVMYGDLDREGYTEVLEDINRIIFLKDNTDETTGEPFVLDPVRGALVTILSTGYKYRLDSRVRQDDQTEIVWDVRAE